MSHSYVQVAFDLTDWGGISLEQNEICKDLHRLYSPDNPLQL